MVTRPKYFADESPEDDDYFETAVRDALSSDDCLLFAVSRLLEVSSDAIRQVTRDFDFPRGLSRDAVYRCVAARAYDALAGVVRLIDASCDHVARLPLRPLAEDYIFLRWIKTLDGEVADRYIKARAQADLADGYEAQQPSSPMPSRHSAVTSSRHTGLAQPPSWRASSGEPQKSSPDLQRSSVGHGARR